MHSPDPTTDLVIYTRSSRADHPWASMGQETEVREHLDRLGIPHDRARVIRDAATAAMRRRPGYTRLAEKCDDGKAFLLAVHDLCRIGRLSAAMALARRIVGLGGRVVAVDEGIDTSRPGWDGLLQYRIDRREYMAERRAYRRGEVCDE